MPFQKTFFVFLFSLFVLCLGFTQVLSKPLAQKFSSSKTTFIQTESTGDFYVQVEIAPSAGKRLIQEFHNLAYSLWVNGLYDEDFSKDNDISLLNGEVLIYTNKKQQNLKTLIVNNNYIIDAELRKNNAGLYIWFATVTIKNTTDSPFAQTIQNFQKKKWANIDWGWGMLFSTLITSIEEFDLESCQSYQELENASLILTFPYFFINPMMDAF